MSLCSLSLRVVLVLPQPDRGALWDTVLRGGAGGRLSASGTPGRRADGRLAGLQHVQEVSPPAETVAARRLTFCLQNTYLQNKSL